MRNYPKHEEYPKYNESWYSIFLEYKNDPFLDGVFSKIYRHGYCLFHKKEDVVDRVSSILTSYGIPFNKTDDDKNYWKIDLKY